MSPVRLQFLGSGDALGSDGRLQTCLYLHGAGDGGVLIDVGASSLAAMKRAGVDPSSTWSERYRFRNFLTLEAMPAGSRPCLA